MEPTKKYQPNIEPDIRPGFAASQPAEGKDSPARDLAASEQSAGNNAGNSSENTPNNLAAVKEAEGSRQGYWTGGNSNSANSKEQMVSLKGILKRKGPIGALIAFGLGLPTIIAIFLSPALVIQQFAESLTNEFNDQLAAMDMRSVALLKKKYNSTLTTGCGTITIRCKYQTIRENSGMAKRLNNAGVTIEGNRSLIPGRIKPTHFVFEGKQIPAKELLNEAKKNPSLRKALQKGYDPLYAAFSDRKSADIRTRLGLKRSSDVTPSTDKEKMNEELKATAAGENDIPTDGKKLQEGKDDKGNTIYTDEAGNTYSETEGKRINNLIDVSIGRGELADKVTKTAVTSSIKGVLTTTALGAGAVDSACTAWTLIRVAGFAAKYYQQRQLISYGYEFMKFAHKQKAGEATAEEVEFFASKLTETNSEGQGALDSDGYKFAAYGDIFTPGSYDTSNINTAEDVDKATEEILLQNETSRYLNGQLVGTSIMAKVAGMITNGDSSAISKADEVCKFTKSWKGQAIVFGLAIAGAAVAILTGGGSVGVGAIAQGAVSVTVSVAFALLQPKLIDMAKGEVIKGDENGNETGNAVASGIGGYNAQTAQGRGLGVATQETYQAYNQLSTQVAAKYAEEDRKSRSPFDPTSKNTFVGGIVANLTPYISKFSNLGSTSLSVTSFVSSSLLSLGMSKPAYAASDKYNQCDDPEYTDRNLAADPFCNLRYAIPVSDLSIDPEEVLDYMINNNHISEDDPSALSDEYADYIAKCFDRQSSIGDKFTSYEDGQSEGNGDPGDECIIGQGSDEKRNRMFRLFYLDTSISDGLEEDFDTAINTDLTGGVQLNIASFNVRGSNHDGKGGTISYKPRMARTVETIQNEGFDIIGFQEFVSNQRVEFTRLLGDTYNLSSKDGNSDNGNGIGWNTSKYDLVGQGTVPGLKYTVGNTLKAPWVKLKDKTTNQMFYFINTHDPANVHGGTADNINDAKRRTANAKQYVKFIKEKESEGLPTFITGDFNSTFKKRNEDLNVTSSNISTTLPYCILTAEGSIQNAFDVYKARKVKCPNETINWNKEDPGKGCETQIDHLYIAPNNLPLTVDGFGCVKKGDKADTVAEGNGSDHDTVKFQVSLQGSAQNSGAGTSFIIGSYNQKRALSANQHTSATNNIVSSDMDIVGTQESTNPKFNRYKNLLSKKGYDVYPSSSGPNQTCSSAQAIFFKKSKFKLLKGEYFDIPRYPDRAVMCSSSEKTTAKYNESGLPAVWTHIPTVFLQDTETSQTIIVINTHNVANVAGAAGTQPAKSRYRSAQIYVEQIRRLRLQNPGIPIFLTGDFNEGHTVRAPGMGNITFQGKYENLLYCMFKENGLMKHISINQSCTNKSARTAVDAIYASPGVSVDWVKEIGSGGGNSGPPSYSDHPVKYAKLTVPGSGGSHPNTGSNIDGDDYAKECSKYLSAGDCTGQCVGFVKFRLVKHGVIRPMGLGNGGSVTATLREQGFKVDTTPAVNSVMSLRHSSVGHTAMVSKVNSDGSIMIEEYNWPEGAGYRTRIISAAKLNEYRKAGIISFAHTEAKYK